MDTVSDDNLDGATAVDESIAGTIAEAPESNMLQEITPSAMRKIESMPPDRMVKIFEIRYKLAHGTYELDEKLDYVLDDILKDLKG